LFGPVGNGRIENRDCGGHGQCMWNMVKGNHCVCDDHFKLLKLNGRQTCCPVAQKQWQKCKAQAGHTESITASENITVPEPVSKHAFVTGYVEGAKHLNKTTESPKRSTSPASKAAENLGEVAEPQTQCGSISNKKDCEVRETCMFQNGTCTAVAQTSADKEASIALSKATGAKPATNFWQKISVQQKWEHPQPQGVSYVSAVCKGLAHGDCEEKGCSFDSQTASCTDRSKWECATNKKILDCNSYKFGSPYALARRLYLGPVPIDLTAPMQVACGKVLGQKPEAIKHCDFGYRMGSACSTSEECPCIASKGMGLVELESETKKRCTQSKGRWIAPCITKHRVAGCAAVIQQSCSAAGYSNLGAMLV